jgi:hypothetical protein
MRLTLILGIVALGLAACGGGTGGGSSSGSGPVGAGPSSEFHPVAGKYKPDDTKFADCKTNTSPQCLEQAFGNLSYKAGPKPTLKIFEKMRLTNKTVESDCHRIVHTIGSAALARFDGNVAKAFSEGSSTCWSGYYHGILERSFAGAKSKAEMATIARTLCNDKGVRADTFILYQCVHGLGHGLMINSGYDLPTALDICHGLATAWDQTSCTGGVFMENISSSYGFKSRWLKDDNLVYPCDVVSDRDKTYCYLMVTSRILQKNGYDFKGAARICAGVEKGWNNLCFQSLGRDASGFTRQNAVRIDKICSIAGTGTSDCIYGAARDIVANDAGGTRAAQLCNAVALGLRARCFNGVGTVLGSLEATTPQRRHACAALTRVYLNDCLRGSGVPV